MNPVDNWTSTARQPPWLDLSVKPEPYQEVLVWVDGHRGPSWQNNHALVAYMNDQGDWREERHFSPEPLVGVIYWQPIVPPPPNVV